MFNMVRMLVEIMTEIMTEIMSVFFLLVLRERAGFAQDVEDASEKWQSNQGGIRGIGV